MRRAAGLWQRVRKTIIPGTLAARDEHPAVRTWRPVVLTDITAAFFGQREDNGSDMLSAQDGTAALERRNEVLRHGTPIP
jgi:hypothetical protein